MATMAAGQGAYRVQQRMCWGASATLTCTSGSRYGVAHEGRGERYERQDREILHIVLLEELG